MSQIIKYYIVYNLKFGYLYYSMFQIYNQNKKSHYKITTFTYQEMVYFKKIHLVKKNISSRNSLNYKKSHHIFLNWYGVGNNYLFSLQLCKTIHFYLSLSSLPYNFIDDIVFSFDVKAYYKDETRYYSSFKVRHKEEVYRLFYAMHPHYNLPLSWTICWQF